MAADLRGKTLFVTGASRGIGKAIALRAAQDGARVVVAAKTIDPHPRLPGTIHSAAAEIEAAGGEALAVQVDLRHEAEVERAVELALERFGGVDILVNNASAISLTKTPETSMKRYDLMQSVNARATFLSSKLLIPALERSSHAHILTISPPLALEPRWFGAHLAYTMSKFGMSLVTLGLAAELRDRGIAVNSLWPRSTIATAAIKNLLGGDEMIRRSRKPEFMAEAAHAVLCRDPGAATGEFLIDEEVLRAAGVSDFTPWAVDPSVELQPDLFVGPSP